MTSTLARVGRHARRASAACLAALTVAALPRPARTQDRPAPDTTRPVVILSEVFSSASVSQFAYAVLAGGTAYRVEVEPARASVSIRYARRPSQPPLVMQAMENPAQAGGGISYLLVPRETADYRVDVAPWDEPVRVRIVRDPREQATLDRSRRADRRGYAALVVRAVHHAGDVTMTPEFTGTPADSLGPLTGGDVCLAIPPGAIRRLPFLGGCILRVGILDHPVGGILVFGLAPRARLLRRGRYDVSVTADYAFGETGRELGRVRYSVIGAGLVLGVGLGERLTLEVEPAWAEVRHDRGGVFGSATSVRESSLRLAGGLRLGL